MQMIIERERREKEAKAQAKTAVARERARRLAEDWQREDVKQNEHSRLQVLIGKQEHTMRTADDSLLHKTNRLRHDSGMALQQESRRQVEGRSGFADAQHEKCRNQSWARGMKAGSEEFALERSEFHKSQVAAVMAFGWAKDDDQQTQERRRATTAQLPMGPNALNYRQNPGAWRADALCLSPRPWTNSPLNDTVRHAHEAQRRARVSEISNVDSRRRQVTSTLDEWGDLGGVRMPVAHHICLLTGISILALS